MSDKHLTNQHFSELTLPEPLARGLRDAGFERLTPIQAEALPPALAGEDVAGQARTGTGKTATFLLAIFNYLLTRAADTDRPVQNPRALVVAPTRELAIQIYRDAEALGKHSGLKMCLAYGGTGYDTQRQAIQQGADIIIGTPGRLIDYLKQHVYSLNHLQVVVVDEADRMFDLGFIRDIRYMFRHMPPPPQRLSMLFSATLSHRVNELAYEHMNNPQVIKVQADKITVDEVTEAVYCPANDEKIPLLLGLCARIASD
ncbi:MAG: DEAD/DEAH box helicase, partial [Gammaproteobacteria bacterium]|nr:DEAD/DEAH box helicase [Gammaproteobacteria bacterium]